MEKEKAVSTAPHMISADIYGLDESVWTTPVVRPKHPKAIRVVRQEGSGNTGLHSAEWITSRAGFVPFHNPLENFDIIGPDAHWGKSLTSFENVALCNNCTGGIRHLDLMITVGKQDSWHSLELVANIARQIKKVVVAVSSVQPAILSLRHAKIDALLSKIEKYSNRPEGWDGQGGRSPYLAAASNASDFLAAFPMNLPLPSAVYAPGDGEVLFQWRKGEDFAEVAFPGDGTVSWYARAANSVAFTDENFDAQQLSPTLREALRHFS